MALLFYIDDILVDAPINAIDLSTSIKRDNEINGITVTQDVELTWNGNNNLDTGYASGYLILYNAFETGSCNELELKIYDQPETVQNAYFIYKGTIKVPSISIDYQKINATTTIQDNSFYAYINNNKNIEFNLGGTRTKNGVSLTSIPVYNVRFFNTSNGVYYTNRRKGYKIVDAFEFLVKALSDDKLSFRSDYLSTIPEMFIFDGNCLADPSKQPNIITTFDSLFNEIYKIYKIHFWIDNTDLNNPVVRIEDESRYFGGINNISFNDIKDLKGSIDTSNLYAVVNVGASNNPDGNAASTGVFTFPTFVSYVGWSEESYTPQGQCNLDNTLDLVNDFHITSNDIANQVNGAVTINLDEYFLVECENINTTTYEADAKSYIPWIPSTNPNYRWYNQFTYNPAKLNTHSASYFTGITNTLAPGNLGFQAGISTIVQVAQPIGNILSSNPNGYFNNPLYFTNETSNGNYDAGGQYNNTSSYYEVFISGEYCFATEIDVQATDLWIANNHFFINGNVISSPNASIPPGQYYGNFQSAFDVIAYIEIFTDNTFSTLITSIPSAQTTIPYNGTPYTISVNTIQNLNTGNCVRIKLKVTTKLIVTSNTLGNITGVNYTTPSVLQNEGLLFVDQFMNIGYDPSLTTNRPIPKLYAQTSSIFNCLCSPDAAGVIVNPGDNNYFKFKLFEFEYDISIRDFLQIKQNPIGLFNFEKDNVVRSGWIQEMSHNDWNGLTSIKLIAKNAT